MTQAIELNSVRRGYDPREFTLVAAGGAGPLFACDIALELEIPRVLVPPHPGITSATGLLATDLAARVRRHRAMHAARDARPRSGSRRAIDELDGAGRRAARRRRRSRATARLVRRLADCRYAGQGYEVRFEVPAGRDRRRLGRGAAARASTPRTSASTATASTPRSRSSTSACVGVGLVPELDWPEIEARRRRPARRRSSSARSSSTSTGRPERRVDAVLRRASAARRRPDRGAGDRRAVRLDDGDPARARRPRSTATATSSIDCTRGEATSGVGRGARHADPDARDRRRLRVDREGDGRRAVPDVLLLDHPRVRGPRRRHLRRARATSSPSRTRRRCSWARCRRSSRA